MAELPPRRGAFLQPVSPSPVLGQGWALGICCCLSHTHLLGTAGTFLVGTASQDELQVGCLSEHKSVLHHFTFNLVSPVSLWPSPTISQSYRSCKEENLLHKAKKSRMNSQAVHRKELKYLLLFPRHGP